MRGKLLGIAAIAVGALIGTASPALAESNGTTVTKYHSMRFERFGTGTSAGWQTVPKDSPLDTNSRAVVVNVATDPDPTDANYYYADLYTNASLNIAKPVGAVKNLSFDFLTAGGQHFTGGAPRISVITGGGSALYLAASGCNNPLSVNPDWSRADFTGRTAVGCSFSTSDGETFSSDGTNSAWANYVAAHPGETVDYDFMVFDEAGQYTVDRISLGTNYLYNNNPNMGFPCYNNEARC